MIRTALVFLLVLSGCGGSGGGGGGGNGGGGGSGGDLAMPPDLANAFMCASAICGGSDKCCVYNAMAMCAGSCPDGGFVAECNSPANCGGNPCCITVANGFVVQSVSCMHEATACAPRIDVGTGSGVDRACRTDADCTTGVPTPSLPDCCTNTATGQHVCFNKSYVAAVMGWTCP
jgi:hypothetical protein